MLFGFDPVHFMIFIAISLCICITLCMLAMEAAVLFVPAFIFLFPRIIDGFPAVSPNEAIGLAITVEFFGYTSSVLGYWFRRQVDLRLALRILAITVPLAVMARVVSFFVPEDGLLIVFSLVLLGLAVILYRNYRGEVRHTCLLCGDSIAAMRMGDEEFSPAAMPFAEARSGVATGSVSRVVPDRVPLKKPYPDLGRDLRFNAADRVITGSGGAFAGLTGVAIGEIANTFLSTRKKIPIKVATGTAAMVLHVTILAALATNIVCLFGDFRLIDVEAIVIPWSIAFILAPVVIIGGQIGSMLNSKLSDRTLVRLMMTAYTVVGVFVLFNVWRAW